MIIKNTETVFFSSVRTNIELKKEVDKTLDQLGLNWSTFINNVAKKLIKEKKVVFEIRDEEGFTMGKGNELKEAMKRAKNRNFLNGPFNMKQAQQYLKKI